MNESHLTAYALGELDAPEREAFERELATSAELQNELKEIVALAETLPLALDRNDSLTDEQRASLRTRFADNRRAVRRESTARRRAIAGIVALAACITVAAIVVSNKQSSQTPAPAPTVAVVTAPVKPVVAPAPAATPAPAPQVVAAAPTPNLEIPKRLSEAKKFLARGSYDLAAMRYNAVLAIDPANIDAHDGLRQLAAATGQYQFAQNQSGSGKISIVGDVPLQGRLFAATKDIAYAADKQEDLKSIADITLRRDIAENQNAASATDASRDLSKSQDFEKTPSDRTALLAGQPGIGGVQKSEWSQERSNASLPTGYDMLAGPAKLGKAGAGALTISGGTNVGASEANASTLDGATVAFGAAALSSANGYRDENRAMNFAGEVADRDGGAMGGGGGMGSGRTLPQNKVVTLGGNLRGNGDLQLLPYTVAVQTQTYTIYPTEFDPPQIPRSLGNESYTAPRTNPFLDAKARPLSTFSIDVDTASYANVRRMLNDGRMPPTDAVRVEEFVNYFPYSYPRPADDAPFSVNTEVSRAPWDSDLLLARIALKGRDIPEDKLPPSNLVFLIDVSGSMQSENKLPLLKRSLTALVEKLSPNDHVAIVTYAGDSGVALKSTSGEDKVRIQRAIRSLDAGGSTNGAAGIKLAYDIARKNFDGEGNNRVILCTDGDFNVGATSMEALSRLIEGERKGNVFLSVLGFGTGNLKDATMEMLADKGNGNYAYIDTEAEGRKVLVEQMRSNLFTIAKDVKIQVEFNPATVAGYRLIGYENRLLAKEDFNNDRKDAGEVGAGHTVTALYEIVPAGQSMPGGVDPLKYQQPPAETAKTAADAKPADKPAYTDLLTVKLRYKQPDSDHSQLIEKAVGPQAGAFGDASEDFRFASAVAAFGMKLRGAASDPVLDWGEIQEIAGDSVGGDPNGYRAEFLTLVKKAQRIAGNVRD